LPEQLLTVDSRPYVGSSAAELLRQGTTQGMGLGALGGTRHSGVVPGATPRIRTWCRVPSGGSVHG